MKILVIGSGGREHALCWQIVKSRKTDKLYCAPGNGGIADIAECVDIKSDDIDSLLAFALKNSIDLTVVGPEMPLTKGIVDVFTEHKLKIFGPDKFSSQLEASKIFAKELMKRFNLPTAGFRVFDNAAMAKDYIDSKDAPFVVKADGLCAGKGVIIAETKRHAREAIDSILLSKAFGSAGEKIIIEDCLAGEEVSIILVSDGSDYILFPSSQDHKRVFDDDKGPNTGGMGAYSPAPIATDELMQRVEKEIVQPLIKGLARENTPYKGVLYIGLMIVDNNPYVLEFNVRFGDPETQAILPRLKSDIVDIFEASIHGNMHSVKTEWDNSPAVCIVCCSGGYPGPYKKGIEIHGLQQLAGIPGIIVFHAGTKNTNGKYFTAGGRVINLTALSDTISEAITKAYSGVSRITFQDMHYRSDIGKKAAANIRQ
jgi:phosphoribosylamine---glycine ligase